MMPSPLPLNRIIETSHDLHIDLIYAGPHNFTGEVIYEHALCLLHPQADAALRRAVPLASKMGLKLKILDAFRPQQAQEALWAIAPLPGYIADPAKGSNHTRGVAIDLTLVDAQGCELDMGTPVDTMTEASHHFHSAHPAGVQLNRARLLAVMLEAGFVHYSHEWWHYQLPEADRFPLISQPDFMRCVDWAAQAAAAQR